MLSKIKKYTNFYSLLLLLTFLCAVNCAHAKPLLSAFYYPGNRRLQTLDLTLNSGALKHLDVLIYAPSIHGLQPMGNTYRMNRISRYNLRYIARYLRTHKLHAKLMLSLGYWDPLVMRHTITIAAVRERFIASIIRTLQTRAYDLKGIDIDWENEYAPIPHEAERFPIFVKELRLAMQRHGLAHDLLTVDVPSNHTADFPDPKQWLPYVNWTNLMGYDFYGDVLSYTELDSTFGYNTTPYAGKPPDYPNVSLVSALEAYQARGIANDKMVVILPLYGAMSQVRYTSGLYYYGLRQPIIGNHRPTYYPYWKIYLNYGTYDHPKNGYFFHKYTFESPPRASGFNSFWITEGSRFLSYPDPIAIKQDADYLVAQRYLGISVWELSDALKFEDPNSLLRIIAIAEGHLNQTS